MSRGHLAGVRALHSDSISTVRSGNLEKLAGSKWRKMFVKINGATLTIQTANRKKVDLETSV